MTDPPHPLTPTECDLRGMEWMPLFGARLFMSDFEARASDEEFRAAVRLWWMAWQQVPAASLPNEDAVLCRLAGYGRDMKAWLKAKEAVLHGFALCSDGRIYHKLLAGQANEAWDRRVKDRERKAAYRAKKSSGGNGTGNGHDEDVPGDKIRTGQSHAMGQNADEYGDVLIDRDKTGQDRTEERKEREREGRAQAPAAPARQGFISSDWWPNAEGLECARENGLRTAEEIAGTIGQFVDHYTANGEPRADWQAQWRKWCRMETDFRRSAK